MAIVIFTSNTTRNLRINVKPSITAGFNPRNGATLYASQATYAFIKDGQLILNTEKPDELEIVKALRAKIAAGYNLIAEVSSATFSTKPKIVLDFTAKELQAFSKDRLADIATQLQVGTDPEADTKDTIIKAILKKQGPVVEEEPTEVAADKDTDGATEA